MSVQSRSDGVNTSLFEKREHIEKLHRTRNLLRKVQVVLHVLFFVLLLPDHYQWYAACYCEFIQKLVFVKKSSSFMIYLHDSKNASSQKRMGMLSGSILEQCQFSRFISLSSDNFPFAVVFF